jgi:hypothetical protein
VLTKTKEDYTMDFMFQLVLQTTLDKKLLTIAERHVPQLKGRGSLEQRFKDSEDFFETAVWVLCSVQLFLEMLCTTSSWIPFIISFIHLEQVLCAVILLVMMIRRTVRDKKAGPLIATVLLLGLNALMQFVQDKPYLFPLPEDTNIALLAVIVFALTAAGLIAAWLWSEKIYYAQSSSVKGS